MSQKQVFNRERKAKNVFFQKKINPRYDSLKSSRNTKYKFNECKRRLLYCQRVGVHIRML